MSFIDPQTVDNPTAGQPLPAAWGDVVRDDLVLLATPPQCSVFSATPQAVTTGSTGEALLAGSESYDTASMHSTVSATSRITAPYDGFYFFICRVMFEFASGSRRETMFKVNGTTGLICAQTGATGTPYNTTHSGVCAVSLVATDYVEVWANHDRGSDLNVTLYEFSARWIGT